jgi:hypothetical protein
LHPYGTAAEHPNGVWFMVTVNGITGQGKPRSTPISSCIIMYSECLSVCCFEASLLKTPPSPSFSPASYAVQASFLHKGEREIFSKKGKRAVVSFVLD